MIVNFLFPSFILVMDITLLFHFHDHHYHHHYTMYSTFISIQKIFVTVHNPVVCSLPFCLAKYCFSFTGRTWLVFIVANECLYYAHINKYKEMSVRNMQIILRIVMMRITKHRSVSLFCYFLHLLSETDVGAIFFIKKCMNRRGTP